MSGPKSKRLLVRGMEGEDVRDAQRKLNARRASMLDENGNRAKELEEDGKFGNETEKAVLLFQRRNRLAVDGKIGDRTWDALNTLLGVFTVSILDQMIDTATSALDHQKNPTSLRMRSPDDRPPSNPRVSIPTVSNIPARASVPTISNIPRWCHAAPLPKPGDMIYQVQGIAGRIADPFKDFSNYYNRALQIGVVCRTSQEDGHAEYGPYLQLQQNWVDPRWSVSAGASFLYADLVHLGPWHLVSFYAQPSLTLPFLNNDWTGTLALGHQFSVDLSKNGNLTFVIQDQVAASIDFKTRQATIGVSGALGFSINIPFGDSPQNHKDFWSNRKGFWDWW